MVDTPRSTPGPRFSRRALARGIAWTTPALVVSTAAPAFAVSQECTPQSASSVQSDWAFRSGLPGWTTTKSPSNGPAPEYRTQYQGLTDVALLESDPPGMDATQTTFTSPSACLARGTYTFTFDARIYNYNPRVITMSTAIVNTTGGATLATTADIVSTAESNVSSATRTLTLSVRERTQIRLVVTWRIASRSLFANNAADDIGISPIRVAKTA